ncbi:MAG: hypothetical protein HY671_01895 [Chloroflexi bacterium]|nr:hypothetical protein [Chloroflexota bacterium]
MPRFKRDPGKYRRQAIRYIDNAIRSLDAGEAEKAGEFVWGSMAQAIKGAAAARDIRLVSHNQLTEFAMALARDLKDTSISSHFQLANSLHSNFYEPELTVPYVFECLEQVRPTIGKLLSLVP